MLHWEKLNSNTGFFMPTVMVYTIMFFTFITWQVYQTMSYQILANNYQTELILETALLKMQTSIIENINNNYSTECVVPYLSIPDKVTDQYQTTISGYCVRKPIATEVLPPASEILTLFDSLEIYPQQLTTTEYQEVQMIIEQIYSLELESKWIGVPLEGEPIYSEVLAMPVYLIYDVQITTVTATLNYMVFYNCKDQQVDQVFYT